MGKASRRRYSQQKQDLIRKRGTQWGFIEEKFCCDIASKLTLDEVNEGLTNDEVMEMLVLLLTSCKYSLVRVKDKSKKTYYNKPHQFQNKYEMLSEIIHKKDFLESWVDQYKKYKENGMRLEYRPTLGRVDSSKGYSLENIEVQAYGENTAQMMIERRSQPCVALVAIKGDSSATLFETPSSKNAIARINEVMELNLTRNMIKGNLDNGLTRIDNNYSVFIVSRNRLLAEPMLIDMGVTIHNIVDDTSVRFVSLPDVCDAGCSKVRLFVDDLGIVYANFVEQVKKQIKENEGVVFCEDV